MNWIKDKLLQVAVLVILIGTIWIQREQIALIRADQVRLDNNISQLMAAEITGSSVLQLKLSELKDYMSERTDSIIEAMGVKPKWVKEIAHITNTYYNTDTNIVVTTPTNLPGLYPWRDQEDKCFEVSGFVAVSDTSVDVGVTERKYNAVTDYILVGKPELKFLGIRFRKEDLYLKVSSDCGTSTVQKINVSNK